MQKLTIKTAALSQLLREPSPYRFKKPSHLTHEGPHHCFLIQSFLDLGIQTPLTLVYDQASERKFILDGYARLNFALNEGIPELSCQIIDSSALHTIATTIFLNEQPLIHSSIARTARFIRYLDQMGLSEQVIIQMFFFPLSLEQNSLIFKRTLAIAALDDDLLEFCHEKGFSFKQCFHLTKHDRELLRHIFSLKESIALSASSFELIFDHIKDILKWNKFTFAQFWAESSLSSIVANTKLTPQQRSKLFLDELRKLRFPTLHTINHRLLQYKNELQLPKSAALTWDPTLETKKLTLTITLSRLEEWTQCQQALQSPTAEKTISHILAEL